MAYEQRLARRVYAYGVDVRRSAMLQGSSIGEPIMRAVDRRWREMTMALADKLEPPGTLVPSEVMEELTSLIGQLRAPAPTVRLLRATESGRWPIATALATTRGGVHWLILDLERLLGLSETARRFALASALGHLQCDHGPLFAAHLIAHLRGGGLGLVRTMLRAWSRVCYFSADRAGLLVTRDLAAALEYLSEHAVSEADWVPRPPKHALRRQALEDFDHADVMARVRLLSEIEPRLWGAVAAKAARVSGPMAARVASALGSAMRMGGKLMYTLDGGSFGPGLTLGNAAKDGDDEDGDAKEDDDDASEAEATPEPEPAPIELDPALAARIETVVREAKSLARCDETLTRRLGLL